MRVLRDVRILMCVMILSLGFGYVSEAQASVRFLGSAADAFGANDNKYDTGTGVVCTPPQVGVGTSWKNANGQQVYSSCKCPDTFKYNVQNCSYPNALSGTACQGNYDGCTCLATFNSSNCTSPKALGGDTCGGKYTTCTCPSDYDQTCTGSGQAGVLPACDGKYKSCGCDASYNQACTGAGESPAGTACGGKYQSCSCSSDYQYTCTNPGQVGVGAACNSKYTSCNCSGSYQSCSCGPAAGASTCTDSNATSFYTACAACGAPTGVCGYWNADGPKTIQEGCTAFNGYGAYATITIPAGGLTVTTAEINFNTTATVQGGTLNVTSRLAVGSLGPSATQMYDVDTATFTNPVIVNGTIDFSQDTSTGKHSTATFNGGLSGSFTCTVHARPYGSPSQPVPCAGFIIPPTCGRHSCCTGPSTPECAGCGQGYIWENPSDIRNGDGIVCVKYPLDCGYDCTSGWDIWYITDKRGSNPVAGVYCHTAKQTCPGTPSCDDTCPDGYSLTNPGDGSSPTATTECGNPCYQTGVVMQQMQIQKCTCANYGVCDPGAGIECGSTSYVNECGKICYRPCNDACPDGYYKDNTGGATTTTACGTTCYEGYHTDIGKVLDLEVTTVDDGGTVDAKP